MDVERRGAKRARTSDSKFAYTKKGKAMPKVTEQQIRKVIDAKGEMKYYGTTLLETAITAGTSATLVSPSTGLFNPAVGATFVDRVGNMCYLHTIRMKIRLRSTVQATTAGGVKPAVCRVALVRDKEPQSSAAAGNVVFTTASAADNGPEVFQNIENLGRFQVLKDKTFVLQDPNVATTGINGRAITMKVNYQFKPPIKIRFNSTTGRPLTDEFNFYAWCDNGDLTPTITYISRACFKED